MIGMSGVYRTAYGQELPLCKREQEEQRPSQQLQHQKAQQLQTAAVQLLHFIAAGHGSTPAPQAPVAPSEGFDEFPYLCCTMHAARTQPLLLRC